MQGLIMSFSNSFSKTGRAISTIRIIGLLRIYTRSNLRITFAVPDLLKTIVKETQPLRPGMVAESN
jgi:hypothetical protein